nr:hypothetical protein CcurKRNrm1_p102 [Cryptomonas curvata]
MIKKSPKEYVFLEIPEFQKNGIGNSVIFFKIFGINSERPIIRLDNTLFEGKWYNVNDSSFLLINKKKNQIDDCLLNQFLFIGNSFFIKNSFKFNSKKTNNFELLNVNCIKKRLRLYRIPLIVDKE